MDLTARQEMRAVPDSEATPLLALPKALRSITDNLYSIG